MATRRASDARAAVDDSFEELYRGHHADVFRAALRELGNVHDAEDVTQAAFVDAYRAVLRGSRPESPRAWLLAIAENVRRRRYRSASRRPREEAMDADFPLAAELPHELASSLAEALAELPDDQRRTFVLREISGMSYDEIADETDSSVGAIQMQLFRARRALRERLEPPAVARRRAGLLLPLPGWLSSLTSRADVVVLTPRAAGALGAAVAVVAGATVAVPDVGADAPPPAVEPRPAVVSVERVREPEPAARPIAVTVRPEAAAPAPAPRAVVKPKPARAPKAPRRAQPSSTSPPREPAPAAAAERPPAAAAAPRRPRPVQRVARVLERPRLPVRLPDVKAELPELPGLPPLPAAPVPEAVTGAVRAAGDGAPPLPAPSLPPVTMPPTP